MGIFTSKPDINKLVGQVVDRRRNGLYDRVLLKSGQLTLPEFTCFQRSVATPGGWAETNMITPGRLPELWMAIIHRFLFLFRPGCADDDVATFLRNYAWEFHVCQKVLQREPALVCAASGHMQNLVEGFGEVDCNGTVKPFGRPYSFRLGDSPIYLGSLIEFKLKFIGTSITPRYDLDFYPILDGTTDYPVQ